MNSSAFTFDVPFSGGGGSSFAYQGTGYANPHAPTSYFDGTATTTYEYDENGNLLSETRGASTTSYTWDYANRLVARGDGTATTTFGYDYSGQRVISQTASSTTVFPNKYFSITSQTIASTTYATSTSYIYAGDQLVAFVEQPLIDSVATGTAATYYVHPDHLGSTNVVTTASGTVQSVRDFLPFGAERVTSGSSDMRRGYIGEFEEGNNLSYLNARFYQSDRGQFLSQDPMFWSQKMNLQNPQSLNSYSYAENNPINKKDPLGLASYIWANGAGMTGVDTWNTGTYYQTNDNLMMYQNAAYAQNNHLGSSPAGYMQFKSLVQKGGPWDYLTKETNDPNGRGYYFFGNQLMSVEDFGNVHYGFVGTAGGFPKLVLDIGGGYAQLKAGDYKLSWAGSFFDDPRDQSNINYGISSYNQSLVSAVNNFSSASVSTRASAVNTFNSGVGATTNESKLWTTPNGAVVTWGGNVVSPGVK